MVARLIHKLKAGSIPYFQPVADTPGLARAVAPPSPSCAWRACRRSRWRRRDCRAGIWREWRRSSKRNWRTARRRTSHCCCVMRSQRRGKGSTGLLGLPVVLLDVDLESALRAGTGGSGDRARAGGVRGTAGRLGDRNRSRRLAITLDRIRQSLFAESVRAGWRAGCQPGLFLGRGRVARMRRDCAPYPQSWRRKAWPSTAWPSCCARRNVTSRWWRKPCGGRASRHISAAAWRGPIRRARVSGIAGMRGRRLLRHALRRISLAGAGAAARPSAGSPIAAPAAARRRNARAIIRARRNRCRAGGAARARNQRKAKMPR